MRCVIEQKVSSKMKLSWTNRESWLAALYAVATTDQPVDYDLFHFVGDWMASIRLDDPTL